MKLVSKEILKGKGRINEKEWILACKDIMGIPIVNEYKHLGARLRNKLPMKKARVY